MLQFIDFIGSDIGIPVSYAYSNDFGETIRTIISAKCSTSKSICVCTFGNFSVVNNNIHKDSAQSDILSVMAEIVQGKRNNTMIFILASKDYLDKQIPTITSLIKPYYDQGIAALSNVSDGQANLVSSPDDVGRALGVEERPITPEEQRLPRVVIIGNSSEMPSALSGMAYNIGCIDNISANSRDSVKSGLNTVESHYINDIMDQLHVGSGAAHSSAVASIRKSIFAGNNVVQDIEFAEPVNNIGGYRIAIEYMKKLKKYISKEKSPKLKIKGSLFVGPAGTGKSRLLTAIPGILGLPGFQLDINAALGAFQGQSETKLKDAIARAKKLAPCVLCIDEVEKMLAGTGEGEVAGNEVAAKLLGIILSAMAEPNNIYWAASANKVSHLPAPLLRKGRFDHIWYVPLPNAKIRGQIFGIHCRLNGIDTDKLEEASNPLLRDIIEKMDGFTGAEIMHVAKETSIIAIADGLTYGTMDSPSVNNEIMKQIRLVKPISRVKEKEIKELETWAKSNTIPVD